MTAGINPAEFPSNSETSPSRPEEKRVSKVISGEVVQRKPSIFKRLTESWSGDDMHTVVTYVVMEVMLPAAKTMIFEAMSQGLERKLFGEAVSRSSYSPYRPGNYTSYNRAYDRRDDRRPDPRGRAGAPDQYSRPARRSAQEPAELIFDRREDAQDTLNSMGDLIDQYEFATVSDLYELVGKTGSFTDDRWGWDTVRSARITRVRQGYRLDLPRPIPAEND